ncbi:MAG: lactate permease LctP family transporter [Thermoguttaceae bacterium]|jgi:lactate permease
MEWVQVYNPTGSVILSTLLAALPIVVLLGLLGILEWSAPRAAAAGLATALAVAVFACKMPWPMALASAGYGACFGLFPIGCIVLGAVFLYSLTVEMGQFEKVKSSVASLSPDRRIQALLIAFCFGAFLEGAAGFGAPVAISAALMIGAGFRPLHAAGLALVANTAPVAFGSLGTPITTLSKVTDIPEMQLSMMIGRQLPFFSLLVPAWMVVMMSGWRGLRGAWPAVLVSGGSFATVQFLTANYLGPTLGDVTGGLTSLVLLVLLLRVWQPKEIWRFDGETDAPTVEAAATQFTRREIATAWVPWLLLSACVFLWGMPPVRTLLDGGLSPAAISAHTSSADAVAFRWWERPNLLAGYTEFRFAVPRLHRVVYRDVPAVPRREKPEEAVFRVNWLSATGTGVAMAAILSAIWMGVSPSRFLRVLGATLVRMRWPLFTIATMLAIAFTTRYSGTDATLGLAFTKTGCLYPFFAAMLGWLGVALTGSDTASNALFGSLQKITAEQLNLSPVLICSANSTGGVMGKMIDAQSIVVSAAATNQPGGEGPILRYVFWHSVALATLMGLLTLAQAYLFPWMIPGS